MSRIREKARAIDGILLLDKPTGMSSNAALQEVKRLYRARKAGHTGSLDPLATGVLPICLGEATKVSGFLLDADKHYDVECRLGVTTNTGDAEGETLETRPVPGLSQAAIESVLTRFTGEQMQVPPMYSALKHQGQRLYKLARQGVEVEREPRRIVIHALTYGGHQAETLRLSVHCTKGTYVRTLVEDIGAAFGCGAHVSALRRTGVGPFQGSGMITLDRLRAAVEAGEDIDAWLLPIEAALTQWPGVNLNNDSAYYLRHGQPVIVPHAPTQGWVRLYDDKRDFMGMGEILDDGRVAPRRLLSQG